MTRTGGPQTDDRDSASWPGDCTVYESESVPDPSWVMFMQGVEYADAQTQRSYPVSRNQYKACGTHRLSIEAWECYKENQDLFQAPSVSSDVFDVGRYYVYARFRILTRIPPRPFLQRDSGVLVCFVRVFAIRQGGFDIELDTKQ